MVWTVVFCGAFSNSGKTTQVCQILKSAPGFWGAIKWTGNKPAHQEVAQRYEPDFEKKGYALLQHPEVIGQKGKDTARMKESGAAFVVWVVVDPEKECLQKAWKDLLEGPYSQISSHWIIEGNGVLDFLQPDRILFVADLAFPEEKWKSSSWKNLAKAHGIILRNHLRHPELEEKILQANPKARYFYFPEGRENPHLAGLISFLL